MKRLNKISYKLIAKLTNFKKVVFKNKIKDNSVRYSIKNILRLLNYKIKYNLKLGLKETILQ